MDVVNRVVRHPQPGETIHGLSTTYHPGGKGANQAVAAALAGGDIALFGAVGEDGFGVELKRTLTENGVDASSVAVKPGTSGIAFITVDDTADNSIILSAGANGQLGAADVDRMLPGLLAAHSVLLQNEIPWPVTREVMEQAHGNGVRVIFNPAPAFLLPEDAYRWIDLLVLNESEAELLTGIAVADGAAAELAADRLLERGAAAVVLTLGERGSLYKAQGMAIGVATSSYRVRAVDTTAAGDTFIGALASATAKGMPIAEGLAFASAAAAIAVTRAGAQESIPTLEEIEAFMSNDKVTEGMRNIIP
ncbi:ribokinase [Cohnella endophytica]|uniref:Deoxyribokinase n=2 Tax=Cohnella endophytica TaxID=2419778 RepID=A0A494XVV5_9BACL|nr:ribokinase [Cohnella endophytica]